MSTEFVSTIAPSTDAPAPELKGGPVLKASWQRFLAPLASLRLTVVLFLAAIFIVLVGTLAQVDKGIWEVVNDYFRVDFQKLFTADAPWFHPTELFVNVRAKLFFPESFFPKASYPWVENNWWLERSIAFPKGWVIGFLMSLNLVAAHLVRFKVQASGARLYAGWGIIIAGAIYTALVILSGSSAEGLQSQPLAPYWLVWMAFQATLFGLTGVCIYSAAAAERERLDQRWMFGILAAVLGLASFAALGVGEGSESTMRILYQVLKATSAGVLLLAGCIAVFRKRAGIVLLHAGVGLMMFYDVLVGTQHVESQMHIVEGETVNFTRDLREPELSVVRHLATDDEVTAVSGALVQRSLASGQPITDPRLPFQITVLHYYPNSTLLGPQQPLPANALKENPATMDIGRQIRVAPLASSKGTDTNSMFDSPSAYVKLSSKEGTDLGTWLLTTHFDLSERAQLITVDGKEYDIGLRFKRLYTDYNVTLNKVEKTDYRGTDRPRDYSSFVTLNDPGRGPAIDSHIWMNNPLRYAGKTFYQSGYQEFDGGKMTTLQVVDNVGWMTPYVSCMMVVVGMLFHFGQTLLRFLQRRLRDSEQPRAASPAQLQPGLPDRRDKLSWGVTAAMLGLAALYLGQHAFRRSEPSTQYQYSKLATIPVWYKGRAMPLDSFARNALMQLSDRQTFKDGAGKSQPALRWLADLMSNEDEGRKHRVFRIENEDVLHSLGLERREGFVYSAEELMAAADKLMEQASAVGRIPVADRNLTQRKLYELANRVVFYIFLERTLGYPPKLPGQPITDVNNVAQVTARVKEYLDAIGVVRETNNDFTKQYGMGPLPLFVPTHIGVDPEQSKAFEKLRSEWETPVIAHLYADFYSELPIATPPALEKFEKIFDSYRDGKTILFNGAVADYQAFLAKHESSVDLPLSKVSFEAWYNQFAAFNTCSWLYVFAFVLGVVGWLCYPEVFQRASFWVIVLVFAVHTWALIGRIYISGRPPVTNLYSSAVFIGWATVLGGLLIELMTRLGAGNVVGAMAGFLTLRIAHGLAGEGDTFVVLEAVLDTQVWLATHVVCVTLGYATTYLAGLFGVLSILLGVFTPSLTPRLSKELARMTYGVLCFALFFSFWGTVLGGLWADDSWGRFWGWDPKENGALIIVLWNALVLHARWGAMIKERGLAVLAVLGNIVVSWSWFGVNELGIGLHSYGFTDGRLLMLSLFVLSQLAIAGIGCLNEKFWLSRRAGLRV